MSDLPVPINSPLIRRVRDSYISRTLPQAANIELSIRIDDEEIEMRGLAAYLSIVDRFYGRLSERGLRSYAQKKKGHLKVSEMQQGSWELLLIETLSSPYSYAIVVLGLTLKYLPKAAESLSATYKNIEDGRLSRQRRLQIQQQMQQDEILSDIDNDTKGAIVDLVSYLYEQEHSNVVRAAKFANDKVLGVKMRGVDREASSVS